MNSIRELLRQIPDPNLSTGERVRLRCQLAKRFEETGNYEAASGALDNLWRGVGKCPNLDTLDERTSGEVLLRVGVLTGWIGSIRLVKGSQRDAKNLINESITIFGPIPDVKKVAEAQIEIALCCMREGALDVARELYAEALAQLDDHDGDLKAVAVLRSAIIELLANRLKDALSILKTAVPLFEASSNDVLRGSFHNSFATVLKNLGPGESGLDYIDQVLNEYAAASFHFQRAQHARYQACVENNVALLCLQAERFAEAYEHLDRAQALLTRLDDSVRLAEVDETRARVLLAQGAIPKAEKIANEAIRLLEKGDEPPLLAEALTTQAVALSRLHRDEEARATFERAISVAEQAGDSERAGLAALTLVEQLSERLSDDELCSILERARNFLKDTQNTGLLNRLTECAFRVLSIIHTARPDWTNFSLSETLHRHEGRFIQMALEDSSGSVTKAAGLLGLNGHQTLSFILNQRHQQLLNARTPIKRRRRRIFAREAGCSQ